MLEIRPSLLDLLIITSLWCLSIVIVNPVGNVPFNDDWSFALTVKHLLDYADFRPTSWASMLEFSHTLWGALFCLPAGFSFTALRISTLTLSLFGLFGCYFLVRDMGQPRFLAIFFALLIGFNPLYFLLSFSFMTDVPFTALSILSALFFARNLRNDRTLDLCIATFFAIAAFLSRQLALALPLAFALSLLLHKGITKRSMVRAAMTLGFCAVIFLGFQQWMADSGRLPALYNAKTFELLAVLMNGKLLISDLFNNIYVGLLYSGLFLLPILLFAVRNLLITYRKQTILLLSIVFSLLVMIDGFRAILGQAYLMPLAKVDMLLKSGLIHLQFRDTEILHLYLPALPEGFWLLVTLFSLIGAAFFITVFLAHYLQKSPAVPKTKNNQVVALFFLLCSVIYLLPLMPLTPIHFYDRYGIPTIALLGAAILAYSGNIHVRDHKFTLCLAVLLLVVFVIYSIAVTKDYLSWNRVRWLALHDLMNQKISPEDIDGGFEFNGWYLYDSNYQVQPTKSKWWVHNDRYRIGFQAVPGYRVIKVYDYPHYLPSYHEKIWVLQRISF